jgi:basic membrane protein A
MLPVAGVRGLDIESQPPPSTEGETECTSGANWKFPSPDSNGDGQIILGVISPGDTTDGGFYQSTVDGAKNFADQEGWEVLVIDRVRGADALDGTRNLVRQGADMIIYGASELADVFYEAVEADDLQCTAFYMNGSQGIPQNEYFFQVTYDDRDAIFLAAAYASLYMQRDGGHANIGFISGGEFDFAINASFAAELGAQHIDPDATVSRVFTGDFDDPALAAEASRAQVAAGANVLLSYLGGAQNAMHEVGQELGVATVSGGRDRCDDPEISPIAGEIDDPGLHLQKILPLFRDGQFTHGETVFFNVGEDYQGVVMCDPTPEEEQQILDLQNTVASDEIDVAALVEEARAAAGD